MQNKHLRKRQQGNDTGTPNATQDQPALSAETNVVRKDSARARAQANLSRNYSFIDLFSAFLRKNPQILNSDHLNIVSPYL